jgi:hypothetical protein
MHYPLFSFILITMGLCAHNNPPHFDGIVHAEEW